MEHIIFMRFFTSIFSHIILFEKYERLLKKANFMMNLLAEIRIILIAKYAYCKISFAFADWIKKLPKCQYENPSFKSL